MKYKLVFKRRAFLCILAIAFAAAAVFLFFGDKVFDGNRQSVPYSQFYALVEQNKIESVTLKTDSIVYSLDGTDYATQNPESPLLKEFLLRHDVQVKEEADSTEIISLMLDIIFYLFFFGIITVAFRKFISPNTFKVVHNTGKTFKDIVGMERLKSDMKQVMDMMQNPEPYRKKGMRMPKGILLEGEPGNGKTLFAKALAGEAKVNFIPAKATDFESMFMAIGPMKVKLLFRKARRKAPCIVFIDEFDGIGTKRNYSGSAIETENTRIVTALLNELDGFEAAEGVLVVAATNSISALDPALIRPGRFDARVAVPYPDDESRRRLVEMYAQGKSFSSGCSPETLAKKFKGFSCAKIESVINKACMISAQRDAAGGEVTLS
ncbi:MAG: ATP-dependent metallopeptidase FtsH/Yme1/Tma family protein, partial [Treponema sp.]|nr:ATP-dependent metallopeptidase FtsH/Yme1/Tma family protein [Treponema sp.]